MNIRSLIQTKAAESTARQTLKSMKSNTLTPEEREFLKNNQYSASKLADWKASQAATAPKPTATATESPAQVKPTPAPTAAQIATALLDEQERRAAAAKLKTREEFNALSTREKGQFFKNGGKLI